MSIYFESKKIIQLSRSRNFHSWPLFFVNSIELFVALSGTCTANVEGTNYDLQAGDVLVTFPNQIHGFQNGMQYDMYQLSIPMRMLSYDVFRPYAKCVPKSPLVPKEKWEASGIQKLFELALSDPFRKEEAICMGYAQIILVRLLSILELEPIKTEKHDAAKEIIHFICTHYRQPITCADIARAVGYHESYVSRVVRKMMKISICEYIHTLRVEDAKELLMQTTLPVTDISAELGFGSIRTFNRVFLEKTGISPREYRKSRGINK